MRASATFLLLLLGFNTAAAQEATLFEAHIGLHEGPIELISGKFSLDPTRLFAGSAWVVDFSPASTSVSLFQAASFSDPGTKIADFTPWFIFPPSDIPGHREYIISRPLTPFEVSDLSSGNWYVDVVGIPLGSPTGIAIGDHARMPIVAVPEPATLGLFGIGAGAFFLLCRRKSP